MSTELKVDELMIGDCVEVLKELPDACVDLVFEDSPFNLGLDYGEGHNDRMSPADYIKWSETWLKELVRITKPTGSIYCHNIPRWLGYYQVILNRAAYFRHWIAWNSMSNPGTQALLPAHYGILFHTKAESGFKFYPARYPHDTCPECGSFLKSASMKQVERHPFGNLISDVWLDIHRVNKALDDHPCQLPLTMLERIILMSSDPEDVVFDPFMGGGTTAVAARKLGRHWSGVERSKDFVKIIQKNVDAVTEESKWNGFYVSKDNKGLRTVRDADLTEIYGATNAVVNDVVRTLAE